MNLGAFVLFYVFCFWDERKSLIFLFKIFLDTKLSLGWVENSSISLKRKKNWKKKKKWRNIFEEGNRENEEPENRIVSSSYLP